MFFMFVYKHACMCGCVLAYKQTQNKAAKPSTRLLEVVFRNCECQAGKLLTTGQDEKALPLRFLFIDRKL